MKNKLLLAGILVLAMAVVFKVGIVFGLVSPPTRIDKVCMTNGGLLMFKDFCPSGSEKIPIGGTVNVVDGGGNAIGSGFIRFIDDKQALDKDGYIWDYKEYDLNSDGIMDSGAWIKNTETLPLDPSIVDKIIFWNTDYFVTNDSTYALRLLGPENNEGPNPAQWVKSANLPNGL